MLDRRSLALLEYLNTLCLDQGYKIVTFNEVITALSSVVNMDKDTITESLSNLVSHEYVSVKYQDDIEFCVIPTSKGRLVSENRIDAEIEKSKAEKRYFKYSFLGAFLGGLAGFTLFTIIFVLFGVIKC